MSVNLGKVSSGPSFKPYIIGFAIISVTIALFVAYTTFAKTTVALTPKKDTSTTETFITISKDATGDLTGYNTVSGKIITKEVQASKTYTGVEKKEVDGFAKGTVTLVNKRSEAQPLLPKTQLVTTNGTIFKTDGWLSIPANGSIEATVTAAEKGPSGNIEPQKLVVAKLWEGWQDIIYAENNEKLSGGTVNDYVVTDQEIENAKNNAISQIIEDEFKKISSEISEDEYLDPKLVKADIKKFTPAAKTDEVKERFEVSIQATLTILIPKTEQLKTVTENNLRKNLEKNKEIITFNLDSTEFTVESTTTDNASATIKAQIHAETMHKIPQKALEKQPLFGRNYQEVIAYYKQFHEIADTKVTFSPWISRVPSTENNIEINISN